MLYVVAMLLVLPAVVAAVRRLVAAVLRHRAELRREQRRLEAPAGPPIERLSADLRRIHASMHRIRQENPPMKARRLQAAELAYDDVLLSATRALGIELQETRAPLHPAERLRTEAELVKHGFRW